MIPKTYISNKCKEYIFNTKPHSNYYEKREIKRKGVSVLIS